MRAFLLRLLSGLALLLLLTPTARAQPSSADKAQFQRRLRTLHFGHRYWDASVDSLQRVLASQHVDSLRLHTLEHLLDASPRTAQEIREYLAAHQEAAALAARLHYPERVPLRLGAYYYAKVGRSTVREAKQDDVRALFDTLHAALTYYDALGPVPKPSLLNSIRYCYDALNQPEAKRVFFQRQLAYYQQHGPVASVTDCGRPSCIAPSPVVLTTTRCPLLELSTPSGATVPAPCLICNKRPTGRALSLAAGHSSTAT
jgi:two-component system NtrC family sensor kinase